jgi:Icc-related predicted phosphoesterase
MGLLRRRNGRAPAEDTTTIFFATDLHGSETCFRKFVRAASFYGADVLVLGGDLTGKAVVPLVERGDHVELERHGERRRVRPDAVAELEAQLAREGNYPVRLSPAEYDACAADPGRVDALFLRLMRERLEAWIAYAQERLDGTPVVIVTAPGNDDPWEVDDVIAHRGGDRVLLREGQVFEIAPGHELLSTGIANPTPFRTHREWPEERLEAHLEALAERLENPAMAIFNIHVPPYDSRLDTAPVLDADLRVRTSAGAQLTGPAGSTAVRAVLERHQPLVSLHGHIHESGGSVRIGRTLAINAGSEYGEGVLRGALVTVGQGRLHRFQATTG